MTDHITLHRAAIQTILRTITKTTPASMDGFQSESVFNLAPENLDTAQLPAAYSLLGSATYNESEDGESSDVITRLYRIQVPVLPIGQATPQIRESLCQPLLEKVTAKLRGYPTLGNVPNVNAMGARVLSDSGIVVLPEFGAKFVGFEVRLQVIYNDLRVFAAGE